MKKISYFLMVGLAFTALQVATVEALDDPNMPPAGMSGGQCDSNPACDPSDPNGNCCGQCDPNPACVMDDPNAIPCCGGPGGPNDHQPGMTGGPNDHRGPGGPNDHQPGMRGEHHDGPPGMQGEHHDGPPIDPRSGQPFAKADEAKFQKYADECEATKGVLSEGSTQELVAEGFTRIQVEKLCKDGPDHHDGPPPGMPPQ